MSLKDCPSERYAPGAPAPGPVDMAQDFGASASAYWLVASALYLAVLVALVGLFRDTAASVIATWYHSSSYNHGFLVIPDWL